MSDPRERLTRVQSQAAALLDDLNESLVGRPVDAVVHALAAHGIRAVVAEPELSGEEAAEAILEASAFVYGAMQTLVEPTRSSRLRFTIWALHVALVASAFVNAEEG